MPEYNIKQRKVNEIQMLSNSKKQWDENVTEEYRVWSHVDILKHVKLNRRESNIWLS